MRTYAKLKNFTSPDCKTIILRNLSRIMDIRIIDLDENDNAITFLHSSLKAIEKVKKELKNIGFPIYSLQTKDICSNENEFHSRILIESFA